MHAVEITSFLDERISELVKNRFPEEPQYPSGESQYASFIMPRDEMINLNDKSPEKYSSYSRSNGDLENHKTKLESSSKNRFVSDCHR
jgi:hypothetical protein